MTPSRAKLIRKAGRRGIPSVTAPRAVGLLASAGLIPAARPHLDQMRQMGFGIPNDVYAEILGGLGE